MVIYGLCFSYTLSLLFPLHLTSLCPPRQGWRGRCRSTWRNRWSRCVSGRCQSPQPRWRRRWWKCPRLRRCWTYLRIPCSLIHSVNRSLTQHSIAIYRMIYLIYWIYWIYLFVSVCRSVYHYLSICLFISLIQLYRHQVRSRGPRITSWVPGHGPLLRRWLRWCERLLWWRCRMWRNSWRESKSSALGDPGRMGRKGKQF